MGLFIGSQPTLLAVDNELVRAVMVKDFTTFMDRGTAYDRENEPLTANLFNLEVSMSVRCTRSKVGEDTSSNELQRARS